jgi:hypothetical protein
MFASAVGKFLTILQRIAVGVPTLAQYSSQKVQGIRDVLPITRSLQPMFATIVAGLFVMSVWRSTKVAFWLWEHTLIIAINAFLT